MITKIIFIAIGGALGSSLRFFFTSLFKLFFSNFPIGTFFVNIIGSFFIGYLINLLITNESSEILIKYFLIIGVLGSFTTFSAFSIEVIYFIKDEKVLLALLYILSSVILSILAAYLGFSTSKIN